MKTLKRHLLAAAMCIPFVAAGCHYPQGPAPLQPAASPPGAPEARASAPPEGPSNETPQKPDPQPDPDNTAEAPRTASVPNAIYHPGRSESLDVSGTLSGQNSATLSGTITFIVTRESSHGRPVNIMNTSVVLRNADGKRMQLEHQAVYEVRKDGRLKLLYKAEDSAQQWVTTTTCSAEPRDYVDGHSEGCETHFDDGSVERTTSAVALDGDYLKVTSITKTTDKSGVRDSTESYWLDPTTGHFVRYSGAVSGSDGSQLTLTGR